MLQTERQDTHLTRPRARWFVLPLTERPVLLAMIDGLILITVAGLLGWVAQLF